MNVITIDRQRFRLELWNRIQEYLEVSHFKRKYKFQIAVGVLGHRTPRGVYSVVAMNKTPDWKAPDSEWVPPEMRGKIIPFESLENPFAGGFIALSGGEGIGIHGTKFNPDVGTMASHGCIRMTVPDLDKLWDEVEIGETTVTIF